MSLVNVVLEQDRAIVGFDTLSGMVQGFEHLLQCEVHASKAVYMPHARAMLAHRGEALMAIMAHEALQIAALQGFDEMAEAMPHILAATFVQFCEFRKHQLGREHFEGSEIILVGWSNALERMQAIRWTRYPEDKGFSVASVGKCVFLPDAEWPAQPSATGTPEQMEAIARDQVAWVRKNRPGFNCGGRLLLAELTRDACSVRVVADLEVAE